MESQVLEQTQMFWSLCAWLGSSDVEVRESVKYYENTLRIISRRIEFSFRSHKQETVLWFNCTVIKLHTCDANHITEQSGTGFDALPLCVSLQVSRPRTLVLRGLFRRAQCLVPAPVYHVAAFMIYSCCCIIYLLIYLYTYFLVTLSVLSLSPLLVLYEFACHPRAGRFLPVSRVLLKVSSC